MKRHLGPLLIALFWSCAPALGPDEIPLVVAQRCPGDASCPDGDDPRLFAGVGIRDITPQIEKFTDTNMNGKRDADEPFIDMNGNGVYDAYYIAGYGNDRVANDVHDPLWARAWVLKQNQTTVAFFTIDAVGLFRTDIEEVRKLLDPALGIDLVVGSATHDHQAPDTLGQWGPNLSTRGVNEPWMSGVRKKIVEAITEAAGKAQPARLVAGSIPVEDPGGDIKRYVSDTRDPVVIDTRMHVLRFEPPGGGKPLFTVVNWSAHPEALGSKNKALSSDFLHWLRSDVEKETGAPVVYVSGALGGQVGPGRIEPLDPAGQPVKSRGLAQAEAWGHNVAPFAARALDPAKGGSVVVDENPRLSFRTSVFGTHIENTRFILAATDFHLFTRDTYGWNPKKPAEEGNYPLVDTEVAYLRIGPTSIITIPGELHPELFIGGYDGAYSYGQPMIDTTQENSSDLALAPKGPYLRDVMDGPVEHRMCFGLSGDFFGYIMPRFNFVVDEALPYIFEAKGDHYEETNSIGPRAEPEIVGTARQLIVNGRGRDEPIQ